MSPEKTMEHIRNDTPLSKLMGVFSGECGEIEQAGMQRRRPSPVEVRGMMFDSVERILSEAEKLGLCKRTHTES